MCQGSPWRQSLRLLVILFPCVYTLPSLRLHPFPLCADFNIKTTNCRKGKIIVKSNKKRCPSQEPCHRHFSLCISTLYIGCWTEFCWTSIASRLASLFLIQFLRVCQIRSRRVSDKSFPSTSRLQQCNVSRQNVSHCLSLKHTAFNLLLQAVKWIQKRWISLKPND